MPCIIIIITSIGNVIEWLGEIGEIKKSKFCFALSTSELIIKILHISYYFSHASTSNIR